MFEAGGTFAMAAGALVAVVRAVGDRAAGGRAVLRNFRNRLGRAIVLGLELLVAADILRSISAEPTLNQVIVLAIVVLIRTFLSFSLEVELEGRWPWQPPRGDQQGGGDGQRPAPAGAGRPAGAPGGAP